MKLAHYVCVVAVAVANPIAHSQLVKSICLTPYTIPPRSFQAIPFPAREFDIKNDGVSLQATPERFQATAPGVFFLTSNVMFNKQAGGYIRNACVIKNDDVVYGVVSCASLTSPNDCFAREACNVTLNAWVFMQPKDYLSVYVYHDAPEPIQIGGETVGQTTWCAVVQVK